MNKTTTGGNVQRSLTALDYLTAQEWHHMGGSVYKQNVMQNLPALEAEDIFIPQTPRDKYTPLGLLRGEFVGEEGVAIIQNARKEMCQGAVKDNTIGAVFGIPDLVMSLEEIRDGMTVSDPRLGTPILGEDKKIVGLQEITGRDIYQELAEACTDFPLFRTPERSGHVSQSPEGRRGMAA
ncbi:MAG: hypothetical protein Q8Q49_05985 [bacterium]|nr:hypothetical protein [bacterium]